MTRSIRPNAPVTHWYMQSTNAVTTKDGPRASSKSGTAQKGRTSRVGSRRRVREHRFPSTVSIGSNAIRETRALFHTRTRIIIHAICVYVYLCLNYYELILRSVVNYSRNATDMYVRAYAVRIVYNNVTVSVTLYDFFPFFSAFYDDDDGIIAHRRCRNLPVSIELRAHTFCRPRKICFTSAYIYIYTYDCPIRP